MKTRASYSLCKKCAQRFVFLSVYVCFTLATFIIWKNCNLKKLRNFTNLTHEKVGAGGFIFSFTMNLMYENRTSTQSGKCPWLGRVWNV